MDNGFMLVELPDYSLFSSEFSWRCPQTWLLCATDMSIICLLYISCKYDFCWLFCFDNLFHGL